MKEKGRLTKILALVGTALLWFPIAAPLLLSLWLLVRAGIWRMDYLMPAELFPSVLLGGALLLWAALRSHSHVKLIVVGMLAAIFFPVAGQLLAVVSGLASGAIEPTGAVWIAVLTSFALYALAVMVVGAAGVLLLRDLFKPAVPLTSAGKA